MISKSHISPHDALEGVRLCLNGELHWEGVGPKPWWDAFNALDILVHDEYPRLIEQLETRQTLIEDIHAWFQGVAAEEGSYVFELADRVEALVVSNPASEPYNGLDLSGITSREPYGASEPGEFACACVGGDPCPCRKAAWDSGKPWDRDREAYNQDRSAE